MSFRITCALCSVRYTLVFPAARVVGLSEFSRRVRVVAACSQGVVIAAFHSDETLPVIYIPLDLGSRR